MVNEQGVAQVPALTGIPNFNLEQELAGAQSFQLDTLTADPKTPIKTRAVRRDELSALTDGAPAVEVHDLSLIHISCSRRAIGKR